MARPVRVASSLRRVASLAGASCPVCVLAGLVAVALAGCAGAVIVLDRARSFEQAELAGQHVADLARQRSSDLLQRIDTTLRLVSDTAGGIDFGGAAGRARLDSMLAQRRRTEPRILGLYLVGPTGAVVAGSSATGFGIGALVPSCLRDQRVETEQLALYRPGASGTPDGSDTAGIVCAVRGMAGGAVVAVMSPDLFRSQFADLALGPNGVVTLFDENGRMLARVGAGGRAATPGMAGEGPPPVASGLVDGAVTRDGGITETRRVDGPVAATVTVGLMREDILHDWWYRSVLVGGSALIVVGFVGLAVLAVRRCERRESGRLERLADMSAALQGIADPDLLTRHLADYATELVPCDPVAAPVGSGRAEPAHDRRDHAFAMELLRPDLVRIGDLTLRHRDAAGFTAADLAFLRLLSRLAANGLHQGSGFAGAQAVANAAMREVERLQAAQETILMEMSDASFTLDPDWRFLATNRNADRLLGEFPEDLRGRSIWEVFPELVGSVFETECRRAGRDGLQAAFDMQWARSDDWLAVRVFPRKFGDDPEQGRIGLAIYMEDISAKVVADDKLRQAAKMDAIGRLTGGIAHDFNNLLTVVLGNIEMLDAEMPETGEIREMHDQIRRAAQSAAQLTHQLLAFARRQPLSPADVDVGRLVTGLDGLLRREFGSTVGVDITCPPSLWHARVDPVQLETAVLNLANNAREAMPLGGRLTIACANLAIRKPDIDQFGEIRPGNYVMLSVSDTGQGIARDVLAKVFDPFFSTKPPGRGTGLGLSMVYGFVTQSGGHARIASEQGRGTTVRLYLPSVDAVPGGSPRQDAGAGPGPLAGLRTSPIVGDPFAGDQAAPARPAAIQPAGAPQPRHRPRQAGDQAMPGGTERVLVVEDSDMVRDYAMSVLTSLGYSVTGAADGPEALSLLDAGLQLDLLLSDVLLPNGMNGLELAEAVHQRRPGLPVLFMSGYIENVDVHHSRLDPSTNLLLKPFRRASLATMVRGRLDQPKAA